MNGRGRGRWIDRGGDELHRLREWKREGPQSSEEKREVMLAWAEALDRDPFAELEAHCIAILETAGMPPPFEAVRHDEDGYWQPFDAPGAAALPSSVLGYAFAETRAEPFSDVWYAAKVCREIHALHMGADARHAARSGYRIGELVTDWGWRRGYKPDILTGRKQRRWLYELRTQRNARARGEVERRRNAIDALLPRLNVTGSSRVEKLRSELEKKGFGKLSERTIRRDLKAIREGHR